MEQMVKVHESWKRNGRLQDSDTPRRGAMTWLVPTGILTLGAVVVLAMGGGAAASPTAQQLPHSPSVSPRTGDYVLLACAT